MAPWLSLETFITGRIIGVGPYWPGLCQACNIIAERSSND